MQTKTIMRPRIAPQTAFSAKDNYLTQIRRYMQHKLLLSNCSTYYNKYKIAHSLAVCNQAFSHALKDPAAYTLKKVCQLVLLNKQSLLDILPAPKNTSYKTSCEKIESIISYANQFLNLPHAH